MEKFATDGRKYHLGELFMGKKLVNEQQLSTALKHQSQFGGKIGSILHELEYITTEELLGTLSKYFGVPSTNLYNLSIEPSVLKIVPFEKMLHHKVLPTAIGNKGIFVAMVDPNNVSAISDLEFSTGMSIQPLVVPASQMSAVLGHLKGNSGRINKTLVGTEIHQVKSQDIKVSKIGMIGLFSHLVKTNASDLLISAGVPPCIKKDSEILRLTNTCLTPDQVKEIAYLIMPESAREEFEQNNDVDFGLTFPELGRFRINIFRQRNSLSVAVRCILDKVPTLQGLGLPEDIEQHLLKKQGLILITGPTGHGKSTTLAAMVDFINSNRRCNIITIEDPIEFLHKHKLSNVNQREVGKDTNSFCSGLRHILRQAPDVIVIGEMRDAESFAIALLAAETGHLVLSTLHSNSSTSTIERIVDIFPPAQQQQIRIQLAECFLLILSQRLIPTQKGEGRILALERLVNSARIRNLIREGKTHQIRSMLQHCEELLSLDTNLVKLCKSGKITSDEAFKYSENLVQMKEALSKR
jgi:twitching motility protein PilT